MGEEGPQRERGLTRRDVVRDGSLLAVAVLAAGPASALGDVAVPIRQGGTTFLSAAELKALRGLVDRFVPGPPEDLDDGALAAGCAEAIDALLASFLSDPPRIYAGAPFSDRGGSDVNHFARFLSLDPYEEKAWRLRIEGSGGRRELEFNGPVKGWQAIYREGLAALDAAAGGSFGDLPGPVAETILRGVEDNPAVAAMIDVAFPHTLQFMYGAPEYGGNKNLAGWRYTNYDGDVQPRGYTRQEIEGAPGSGGGSRSLEDAPLPVEKMIALSALGASAEAANGAITRSEGTLSGLRRELGSIVDAIEDGDLGAR